MLTKWMLPVISSFISVAALAQADNETFIGAGDSIRIQLLAELSAPPGNVPYPTVFKVTGQFFSPNGEVVDIDQARIIASGISSQIDSRVLFELHTLNIRRSDGTRAVIPIEGWIVGNDGLRGLPGIAVDTDVAMLPDKNLRTNNLDYSIKLETGASGTAVFAKNIILGTEVEKMKQNYPIMTMPDTWDYPGPDFPSSESFHVPLPKRKHWKRFEFNGEPVYFIPL